MLQLASLVLLTTALALTARALISFTVDHAILPVLRECSSESMQAYAKLANLHAQLAQPIQATVLPACVATTLATTITSQGSAMPINVLMATTVTPRLVFACFAKPAARIAQAVRV